MQSEGAYMETVQKRGCVSVFSKSASNRIIQTATLSDTVCASLFLPCSQINFNISDQGCQADIHIYFLKSDKGHLWPQHECES